MQTLKELIQPDIRLAVPLLALDLDGTVRYGKDQLGHFVNGPDDVVVFPEAITMMARWRDLGGRIVGVSNQGGIALGHHSLAACEAAVDRTQELTGNQFDRIAYCRHHPAAPDPTMARCACRKPSPGLIILTGLSLMQEYPEQYPSHLGLMVGDRHEDRQCAQLAGFDFRWAKEWRSDAGHH